MRFKTYIDTTHHHTPPKKLSYIPPIATFEDMEGDGLDLCIQSDRVTGSDGYGDGVNPENPPFPLPGTAKESDFIDDEEYFTDFELDF